MKIIKPYYKILTPSTEHEWRDMLTRMEYCTRISHRSEERISDGTAQKLLKFIVMEKGDFSVIEHSMMTVEFVVDRGIQQELTRHRLFSYTIESTRFVNYEKKMPPSFIYPQVDVECKHCLNGVEANRSHTGNWYHIIKDEGMVICLHSHTWLDSISNSENNYKELIRIGWRPQEARSVMPLALASKIAVTSNIRNWRHILNMRTSAETHPQFRQVTIPLLKELQENKFFGWLFEDITPNGKQSEMQHNIR